MNTITVNGVSRLRAYPRGFLPFQLARGLSLQEIHRRYAHLVAYEHTKNNLITTAGLALVAKMLNDEEDTGLTYHAIGTGSTTPVIGNTQLAAESNRKIWTSKVRTGATIAYSMFYLASESTFNIRECGVFGAATASGTANSGTLFSRYLQAYDNSAGLVDLTFEYELTVGVP